LSEVVPVYLYCPASRGSVSLGVYPGMHDDRPPSHSAHLAPSAQAELSSGCGHGLELAVWCSGIALVSINAVALH